MHEIAAIANVEPWDYTLREMKWRLDAIMMEEWDRVAWLCSYIPRFSNKRMSLEDFHPIRRALKKIRLSNLNTWIDDMKNYLPKTLTEGEIAKKWKAFKKKYGSK